MRAIFWILRLYFENLLQFHNDHEFFLNDFCCLIEVDLIKSLVLNNCLILN